MKTPSLRKVFASALLIYGTCSMAISAGMGKALDFSPGMDEFKAESKHDFKVGAATFVIGGLMLIKRKPKN